MTNATGPGELIERLCRATNDHDLEALVDCFAEDFRNEAPHHPARGFSGRDRVRRNWEQIFAGVPDITATVRWVAQDDEVWSEWEMRGTRRDGVPLHMCGPMIFGVRDGRAAWVRFYLDSVDEEGVTIDASVRRYVGAEAGTGQASEAAR